MQRRGYEKAMKEAVIEKVRSERKTHLVERSAVCGPSVCSPSRRVTTRSKSKLETITTTGQSQIAEDKRGHNYDSVIHQPKLKKMKASEVKKMKNHVRRSERLRVRGMNMP